MNGEFPLTAGKAFIYPFFWPDENSTEHIEREVEAVYQSGCGGLCLEARPFEQFGRQAWWNTARCVLEAAKKRGMKVWILDDKHFPTGCANGAIKEKYPHLRRHYIYEHHLDVYGPKNNITFRLPMPEKDEKIIGACAFRRTGEGEIITGEPIIIDLKPGAEFGEIDVPEGLWRIFVLFDTCSVDHGGKAWHIDMLSKESAAVLIEAVYEEHYKELSEYFGTTLTGFFSDEPCFGAKHTERFGCDTDSYFRTVGQPGVSLPWNETVAEEMAVGGFKGLPWCLPALWYEHGELSPRVRLAYMDAVTRLWNRNFTCAVGDWCRAHGVIYTGHIIEDLNAHSRLGCSAGHYFRGLGGQDISGIDIVLHQVMPGMSDYITSASVSSGIADGAFYHYTLAQLGSSLARIMPHMQGRAMCELFGAYGWAESVPFMKWLADFLMIRGINRFVPHAFSVKYPFDDCPPHFYAAGNNPQFKGFSRLMGYINSVSLLLDFSVKKTDGAIFYYAENEWMSGNDFMYCDKPAKSLYDSHIDYDILPLDALETAVIADGKLVVNGIPHGFLVIPAARLYPEKLKRLVKSFIACGLPVFTATDGGNYDESLGTAVKAGDLGTAVINAGLAHDYGVPPSKVRIARFDKADKTVFYLFNEEPAEERTLHLKLPVSGSYGELHILNDEYYGKKTDDGSVNISLLPGESVLLVFGEEEASLPPEKKRTAAFSPEVMWNVEIKETGIDDGFKPYKTTSALFNITSHHELPGFSGEIKYSGVINLGGGPAVLNLGEVGFTAELKLNGKALGCRIAAPYEWDISDCVIEGENLVEIIAANTLSNRLHDDFSTFIALPASGLMGPVTVTELE